MDLTGVDAIAAREFRHRAVLANRRQCHLRLEVNAVFFCEHSPFVTPGPQAISGAGVSLSYLSKIWGPPHTSTGAVWAVDGGGLGFSARMPAWVKRGDLVLDLF